MPIKKKRSIQEEKVKTISKMKKLLIFILRLLLAPFYLVYEILKSLLIKIPITLLAKVKFYIHKSKLFVLKKPIAKPNKRQKFSKFIDDGDTDGCYKFHRDSKPRHEADILRKGCNAEYSKKTGSKLEMMMNKLKGFVKGLKLKFENLINGIIGKIKSIIEKFISITRYVEYKILDLISELKAKLSKTVDSLFKPKKAKSVLKKKSRIITQDHDDVSFDTSIEEQSEYLMTSTPELPTFEIIKKVTNYDIDGLKTVPSIPHKLSRRTQFTSNCTNAEISNAEEKGDVQDVSAHSNIDDYFKSFDAVDVSE